jgi:hypothetical protein
MLAVGVTALVARVHRTEILLDACLGLLGALLALVYEMHRRIGHRIRAADRRALLLAPADAVPGLLEAMLDIATSARNTIVGSPNEQLFMELMDEKIGETKVYMHDLERGHIRVPAGADTPMSNQIDVVKQRVQATTIAEVDTDWWLSPDGHEYLDRNAEAIASRGVTTERIVLWQRADVSTERKAKALAEVVDKQTKAGVTLRFIDRSTIDEQNLRINMAIYDGTSYNDVAFNVDGKDIWVDYYFDPNDAKQAAARFKRLWRSARVEIPTEIEKHLPGDRSSDNSNTPADPSREGCEGAAQALTEARERTNGSQDGNRPVAPSGVEGAGQDGSGDDDEGPAAPPDPAPHG